MIRYIMVLLFSPLFALIINVPEEISTIQGGIEQALTGDTVLVYEGLYIENINFSGKNITVASKFLTTQDTSYISNTIIDGNQNGSVVVFESGEDSTAVLTGFTLQNGNGEIIYGAEALNAGGGIFCLNSNPSLNNLIIQNNTASVGGGIYFKIVQVSINNVEIINNSIVPSFMDSENGGGLFISSSDITITNSKINYNSSDYGDGGGGLCIYSSNMVIYNSEINHNETNADGGGLFSVSSNLSIENTTISGNSSYTNSWSNGGGGLRTFSGNTYLSEVDITNNYSGDFGGGICNESYLIMDNCRISNNYSSDDGGGIMFFGLSNSNSVVRNTLISNNTSTSWGGGIGLYNSHDVSIINTTIVGNLAGYNELGLGGGIFCSFSTGLKLINSILQDNVSDQFSFSTYSSNNGSALFLFTNIQGGQEDIGFPENGSLTWLEGNIDIDPLFNDADNLDYTLSDNSPCIDAGTAFYVYEGDTLINLSPGGYVGSAPDMGYYEVGQNNVGDLNQDGSVDVLDIVSLIGIILGEEPTEWEAYAGDLNSDGNINVLDVVQLVNMIIER